MAGARQVQAISYHDAVCDLVGPLTVRAVFDRAWHLESADGWIVTVTTAPYNGPLGIRVGRAALEGPPVLPGDRVEIGRGRRARHGGQLYPSAVHMRLEDAHPWRPPTKGNGLDLATLRRDVERATLVAQEAPRGGLAAHLVLGPDTVGGPTWQRRGVDGARALAQALAGHDAGAARTAVPRLLGLGPGLTPAGDDLLCGLLAGLAVLRRRMGADGGSGQSALRRAVEEAAPGRTTSLSCTLLRWAGHGVAVEPLLDVLWSLGAAGEMGGLRTLLGIGHSSGSDMLTGALLAAAIAVRWEDPLGATVGGSI